jgi:hypothetical protein
MMPKTDVRVKLTGTDGNVFALAGKVSAALERAGHNDLSKEFQNKLIECRSYDAALSLMQDYVKVS